MPRPEKVQAIAGIKERMELAEAVFVAEYAGLTVKEQQQLRRGLRAASGEFKVVKMTLARRAMEELGHPGLLNLLVGPAGLAYANRDASAVARVLRDFARDHPRLMVKGALFGDQVLAPERVSELADLASREVLLARVAGALQAPASRMAGLLAAVQRGMATAMQQLADKKGPGPSPASDSATAAAAADQPAEEAETHSADQAEEE
jgi:large subunit ribosomal protein L10